MIANNTSLHQRLRPITQKLTTTGHCTTFNNEQSPYHITSYKRSEMTNAN